MSKEEHKESVKDIVGEPEVKKGYPLRRWFKNQVYLSFNVRSGDHKPVKRSGFETFGKMHYNLQNRLDSYAGMDIEKLKRIINKNSNFKTLDLSWVTGRTCVGDILKVLEKIIANKV